MEEAIELPFEEPNNESLDDGRLDGCDGDCDDGGSSDCCGGLD